MLVDKQSELMSDLLFTGHQHGGDDVTWKPPIILFAVVIIRVITNRIGLELGLLTLFVAEMTFYIFYAVTILVRRLS